MDEQNEKMIVFKKKRKKRTIINRSTDIDCLWTILFVFLINEPIFLFLNYSFVFLNLRFFQTQFLTTIVCLLNKLILRKKRLTIVFFERTILLNERLF